MICSNIPFQIIPRIPDTLDLKQTNGVEPQLWLQIDPVHIWGIWLNPSLAGLTFSIVNTFSLSHYLSLSLFPFSLSLSLSPSLSHALSFKGLFKIGVIVATLLFFFQVMALFSKICLKGC